MLILYILLGLLALCLLVVLLVLFVPVTARIAYDDELRVRVRVLGIPITLLPSQPKEEKEPPDKPKKKPAADKPPAEKKPSRVRQLVQEIGDTFKEDGIGATVDYLRQLAALAGKAVGGLLGAITVTRLKLTLLIVGEDAADTAVRYGEICAALYPALTVLERVIRVRRREMRVEPGFLTEDGVLRADVRLRVWVYRAVGTLIKLLIQYLFIKDSDHKEVLSNGK